MKRGKHEVVLSDQDLASRMWDNIVRVDGFLDIIMYDFGHIDVLDTWKEIIPYYLEEWDEYQHPFWGKKHVINMGKIQTRES